MASTGLIRDDESPPAYESPIDSILLKMRRQNPVAAAVSTGYPYSSTHVNLDESILENWMAEPYSYYDGSNHNPTIHSSSSKPGFPTHQEALLQSTPKLRFISPRRNRSSSAVEAEAVFKSRRYSSVSLSRSRVSIDITYVDTLEKIRIDEMAGEKLASVLTTLAHEMTNENYNVTESQVFSDVFALVHSSEKEQRMAGIAAITALLDVPSADDEKKAIKFANTVSKSLRTGNRDYEFIVLVTRALGKMAFRTANVDLVEAEVTRCLEWLDTERSDRKLAAALCIEQLAMRAPATFYSKANQASQGRSGSSVFVDRMLQGIYDMQPIVRCCSADALAEYLKIVVSRKHSSMVGILCKIFRTTMTKLQQSKTERTSNRGQSIEAGVHGSLLAVSTLLACTDGFLVPRFEEVCDVILNLFDSDITLVQLELYRLLPQLAATCRHSFGRRYLKRSLSFLLDSAQRQTLRESQLDIRPQAYSAIGGLVMALVDSKTGSVFGGSNEPMMIIQREFPGEIFELNPRGVVFEEMEHIFAVMKLGIRNDPSETPTRCLIHEHALVSTADLASAFKSESRHYLSLLLHDLFEFGLSESLVYCLTSICRALPEMKAKIDGLILEEVSQRLTDVTQSTNEEASAVSSRTGSVGRSRTDVADTILCLRTLSSLALSQNNNLFEIERATLLPLIDDVSLKFLGHRKAEVRLAAASTCCCLLLRRQSEPTNDPRKASAYSGLVVDRILGRLVKCAVSDTVDNVRLCIIESLDDRYDRLLCQRHQVLDLFLVLQDQNFVIKRSAVRLLGRLSRTNPGSIIPVMRSFLSKIVSELQCDIDSGQAREEAIRVLGVFFKAPELHSLISPMLPNLISVLRLSENSSPQLVSVNLETLGDLASAVGDTMRQWVSTILPPLISVLNDQSSVSKQQTSLRTLGQIASATGYVIEPYTAYPNLLRSATDILPATKRAPWPLRREVIRTLGILGALDPDKLLKTNGANRQRSNPRGSYFEESHVSFSPLNHRKRTSLSSQTLELASTYMHEQYAMFAQPMDDYRMAARLTPANDVDFYPTVVIQSLLRIFRNPNLNFHHGMVIQAIMFIFKSMGIGCVPYLDSVVPEMLSTIENSVSVHLRETVLKHLVGLCSIVEEHLRPYIKQIFDIVETLWTSRHLSTVLSLVSKLAVGVNGGFKAYVPKLVKRFVTTFDEVKLDNWALPSAAIDRLTLILHGVMSLKSVFIDHLHVVIPSLVRLASSLIFLKCHGSTSDSSRFNGVESLSFQTVSLLIRSRLTSWNIAGFAKEKLFNPVVRTGYQTILPPCVVLPILDHLHLHAAHVEPSVCQEIVRSFVACAALVGLVDWNRLYDADVRAGLGEWVVIRDPPKTGRTDLAERRQCERLYFTLLAEIQELQFSDFVADNALSTSYEEQLVEETLETVEPLGYPMNTHRPKGNYVNLQRAWDVSQCTSRDDFDEWMRRFSIQLLRESSSQALRSTAILAQAYQPLSRELFNAAFASCWGDLSDGYRASLVSNLQTVFISNVSPEILQVLLNLAEFMEHHPRGRLPISTEVLASLALRCRAYGKALHYKEQEFTMDPSSHCIEALVNINGKLDLQDAAIGILRASRLSHREGVISSEVSDLFYSVIWATSDTESDDSIDIAANEELWLTTLGSLPLSVYRDRLKENPMDTEAVLGCMRCHDTNGEWREVMALMHSYHEAWSANETEWNLDHQQQKDRKRATRLAARASWQLGDWSQLEQFASLLREDTTTPAGGLPLNFDTAFFNAVLQIHDKSWDLARFSIDAARRAMDQRLTALMAESYGRAYPSLVTAQTLAEMEEIIQLQQKKDPFSRGQGVASDSTFSGAKQHLLTVWKDRLSGCREDVDVYSEIYAVRSLAPFTSEETVDEKLRLVDLCSQTKRMKYGRRILLDSLLSLNAQLDGPAFGLNVPEGIECSIDVAALSQDTEMVRKSLLGMGMSDFLHLSFSDEFTSNLIASAKSVSRLFSQHRLYFSYVKHLWATEHREEAASRLEAFCCVVNMMRQKTRSTVSTSLRAGYESLSVASWLELGDWKRQGQSSKKVDEVARTFGLATYQHATSHENCGYQAWHKWGAMNYQLIGRENQSSALSVSHIEAAVIGFVCAINVGTRKWSASVQQDLLNLLTCLFKHGAQKEVAVMLAKSFESIRVEAWLGVLPQMLARIHITDPNIRSVLHPLLAHLGETHPQALMYPLSVLLNSPFAERKASAQRLMRSLQKHSSALVEEAQMVSTELIRVAILWLEMWHEGLEDASRLYFGEGNVAGMLDVLLPLHEMVNQGAQTNQESLFLEAYGTGLSKAYSLLKDYMEVYQSNGMQFPRQHSAEGPLEEADSAINLAWDEYYIVFRRINKQLPSMKKFDLDQCSPSLSQAQNLELGVPGTYRVDGSYVKIESIFPHIEVMASKQRPRKITMRGSDGRNYLYLLKGHEDLRQDERVMQLFGLVNALLVRDPQTKQHDLRIQRYAIAALSHHCGLVGWVPHSDTLHSLIREHREAKSIPLNMENREMMRIAPNYDGLTVLQKVEVFTSALQKSTGQGNDLYEILWDKSSDSEEWLERRTKYTRSLAVMSMVGHMLGLGDRHPSNLMLDKLSGRILHIDLGDCFEIAKNREKFPEKVPFRLTRMLVKAMEVCGVEGSYRTTCERSMSVLRRNADSLLTMLEAFVYDPLINWRLADVSTKIGSSVNSSTHGGSSSKAGQRIQDMKGSQIYSNIQAMAADASRDSRIASIAANRAVHTELTPAGQSRIEKSLRQPESMLLPREGEGELDEKALRVIQRVQEKLNGTEFFKSQEVALGVPDQVQRLIAEATSSENLCQLYIGWCSFW